MYFLFFAGHQKYILHFICNVMKMMCQENQVIKQLYL